MGSSARQQTRLTAGVTSLLVSMGTAELEGSLLSLKPGPDCRLLLSLQELSASLDPQPRTQQPAPQLAAAERQPSTCGSGLPAEASQQQPSSRPASADKGGLPASKLAIAVQIDSVLVWAAPFAAALAAALGREPAIAGMLRRRLRSDTATKVRVSQRCNSTLALSAGCWCTALQACLAGCCRNAASAQPSATWPDSRPVHQVMSTSSSYSCHISLSRAAVLLSHGHVSNEIPRAELAVQSASMQLGLRPATVTAQISGSLCISLHNAAQGSWEELLAPASLELAAVIKRSRCALISCLASAVTARH